MQLVVVVLTCVVLPLVAGLAIVNHLYELLQVSSVGQAYSAIGHPPEPVRLVGALEFLEDRHNLQTFGLLNGIYYEIDEVLGFILLLVAGQPDQYFVVVGCLGADLLAQHFLTSVDQIQYLVSQVVSADFEERGCNNIIDILNKLHSLGASYYVVDEFHLIIVQVLQVVLVVHFEHGVEVIENVLEQGHVVLEQIGVAHLLALVLLRGPQEQLPRNELIVLILVQAHSADGLAHYYFRDEVQSLS